MCRLVSFASVSWCGLITSLLHHRAPKIPIPVGLCPEEEEKDKDEEKNEEENEDKDEEEAFNHLFYWFHRDWDEKPIWLPSSLLLLLVQSCLSSSRSLPLPSLSCVSQSPSKIHHYYFPRLPSKPALAYGWKEMFTKSSCPSLNTSQMLPTIKETFIIISPNLKLTGINFLGLGSLFFLISDNSKQQKKAFMCSFNFLQFSLFYRVLC